jgi:glycosyltransferase involved in cell wall biosynthesis
VRAVFVLERPTPQRTPVLDAMTELGTPILALYHRDADPARGWGPVVPGHPSLLLRTGSWRSCVTAFREVMRPETAVLCCFGYRRLPNVAAIVAARVRRIQIVTRSDTNWLAERDRRSRHIRAILLRLLFGKRTRVWTIGSQNERFWREVGLRNRHLIPYDTPNPPTATPEQGLQFRAGLGAGIGTVFLFVGVLERHKGIHTLLSAFRRHSAVTSRLVVVGHGSLASLVSDAANADDRIVQLGARTQQQLGAIYAGSDVLVLPSHHEPWGLVVNEAQANGLRILVSDRVGAAYDRVEPGTGAMFPAGDVERLVSALDAADREVNDRGRLPRRPPFDATQEMVDDLRRLGVPAAPAARVPSRDG